MEVCTSLALALALALGFSAERGNSAEARSAHASDQEPGKPAATPSPSASPADSDRKARLDAITSELEAATKAFRAAVADAKTDEERRALHGPDPSAYLLRVWEIVRENPRDATSLEALTWLIEDSKSPQDRDQALAAVARDFRESPDLAPLCTKLGGDQQIGTELLELVASANPDRTVRGFALYAIAGHRIESARAARKLRGPADDQVEGYKRWLGRDRTADLLKTDPAALEDDAVRTLERVSREFGDVPYRDSMLGVRADADLREMRDLNVGKEAPEITGEDLDGVPFRLSDYRGKVVLLDFWGNW
jgi:hypothetical protein